MGAWRNTILVGDVREKLRDLPDECVQTVVTSPPYWGLRDYGTASWEGGDADCEHTGVRLPGDDDKSATNKGSSRDPVSRECRRCGAVRIDSQLGLEPTPEAYVESMVAVFREVRRVLRNDGTLWLNLGDCYAAGPMTQREQAGERSGSTLNGRLGHVDNVALAQRRAPVASGLKPKDLVGIPWRVAFALQQPYYTGTIRDERDRIWLAAMVDGEGCLFLHKRKIGQNNGQGYARKSDTYGAGMEIANTSEAIIQRCLQITGRGSVVRQEKDRRQPLFRWNLRSNECRDVIREIYPYLVGKQKQARLVLGCPSSGPDAEAAHAGLIGLHGGVDCAIDFEPPAPMYEPGWYVRSDVIWSKSNPMPESVTDRPTKAHEYIFLLSKSATYYYDHEAIREPAEWARWGEQTIGKEYRGIGAIDMETLDERREMGRNKRSVWTVATKPYAEAHFATYPPELIKPCILAGTSEHGCCSECGAPWRRMVEREPLTEETKAAFEAGRARNSDETGRSDGYAAYKPHQERAVLSTRWEHGCKHEAPIARCVVLDPFLGSGTTGLVAYNAGRDFVGVELNPTYAEMAERRIGTNRQRLPFQLGAMTDG